MTLFLIAIAIVFISTGLCALVEAALYAVRRPYIRQLAETGSRSGELLAQYKDRMDYPISAILIFDTMLGVGGAAIAGAQAHHLFGPEIVIWFSIALSATLLIVSQIIPKIVGVVYCKPIASYSAIPIQIAISTLYPVVWLIERFTRHLKPDDPPQRASEEEVKQMARISAEEGSILGVEAELIQNSLELNDVRTRNIMTPQEKVISLPADMTVKGAFAIFQNNARSRIPIFSTDDETVWVGIVSSRDILTEMAQDHDDVKLGSIANKFHIVPAETPGHILLDAFLKHRQSLFGVESNGQMIGIVSLADVMEEIIGSDLSNVETISIEAS